MANSPAMESLLKYRFQRKNNSKSPNDDTSSTRHSPVFDTQSMNSEVNHDSPIIQSKKSNNEIITLGSSPWFSKNGIGYSDPIAITSDSSQCSSLSENVLKLQEMFPDMKQELLESDLKACDNIIDLAVDKIIQDKKESNVDTTRKRCFISPDTSPLHPNNKKLKLMYSSDEASPTKIDGSVAKENTERLLVDGKSELTNGISIDYKDSLKNDMIKKYPLISRTEIEECLKSNNYSLDKTNKYLSNIARKLDSKLQTDNIGSIKSIFATRAKNKLQPIQKFKEKKPESRQFKKIICLNDSDSDGDTGYVKPEKEEIKFTPDHILKFFSTATEDELTFIGGCSKKKSELIVGLRPFGDFENLKSKLERHSLSSLLAQCKDLLKLRHSIQTLMEKCEEISQTLEMRVASLVDVDVESKNGFVKQPALLNDKMKLAPYQLIGLNWLILMHSQHINGILGDEMGLGKTIQVISFLAYLLSTGNLGPHVIIAPSSTIDNWLRELKLWCPALKILLYYGSQEERREMRFNIVDGEIEEFHIILTSYTMASGNGEDRVLFKKFQYEYAIFDEGHMLKNMVSMRYQNLMKISARRRLLLTGTPLQNNLLELMSLLSFIMPDIFLGKMDNFKKICASSGSKSTDVRGSYEKETLGQAKRILKPFFLRRLKSQVLSQLPPKINTIIKVPMNADQSTLYNQLKKKFADDFRQNLIASQAPPNGQAVDKDIKKKRGRPKDGKTELDELKYGSAARDSSSKETGSSPRNSTRDKMGAGDRNRSSRNVAKEKTGSTDMTKWLSGRSGSKDINRSPDSNRSMLGQKESKEETDVIKSDDSESSGQSGSAMMMQLRKAANHQLLHRQHYNKELLKKMAKILKKEPSHSTANIEFIIEDMEVMSDFELHSLCLKYEVLDSFKLEDEKILDSGKFRKLDHLLPLFKEQNGRVLLFSQFTMVLDIIEEYMTLREHQYLRLDGQTAVAERQELIDEFNSNKDIFVFLLSTKAGGLGINLTSANIVLIHDIDFNPYNDKQAEDRCHRVGQTREVSIYRLISEGTIEEAMLRCASNKLKLETEVTGFQNDLEEDINTDVASLLKEALQV